MKVTDQISRLAREFKSRSRHALIPRRSGLRRLLLEPLEDRRLMATIDLNAVFPATQLTRVIGNQANDQSSYSVSNAGDVNGDGFDDLIIGAYLADPGAPARDFAGKTYVIFGSSSLPATITLSDTLSTTNPGVGGFTILGQAANDSSGISVSSAGDVNGDGFDDLIVGANLAAAGTPARSEAGKSYVIFGGSSLPAMITLSDTLSTTNPGVGGFTILGQAAGDYSGRSVSSAGDVNGDGFDDLIVGGNSADPGTPSRNRAGKSYVILGGSLLPATITLSDTLSTTNPGIGGFTILGQEAYDYSGISVSNAGDVNGDGFDDLIVGAIGADRGSPVRSEAGKSYVILGGSSLPATITLSDTLSTTNPGVGGFTILGQAADDFSGNSVSSAGDVNGDGFDDLIVGEFAADPASDTDAGKSYVIFGGLLLPATITLSDMLSTTNPGVGGFTILGQEANDYSGNSVSSAGDVNGDGVDDLIVGAYRASPASGLHFNAGKSYVIFGGSLLPATITLSDTLSTTNPGVGGISILGQAAYDYSGRSVSNAGDINGDGFDDLIVGADGANSASGTKAGKSYVIYGSNGFTNSILPGNLGTSVDNTIYGAAGAQILNGADGDDILVGLGGADILLGGRGNDILAVSDLAFNRIVGGNGNDTLRLEGSGHSLNLTTIRDNRILDIETIDISGSGNNTLTLNQLEVLNISDESNTLIVRRNMDDIINIGSGWTQLANETIGLDSFLVYSQGQARLKVQAVGVASIAGRQVFYNNANGFGTSGANNSPLVNPINAIDDTKQALLPSQTTTTANYTNYSRGLNGIVVDLTNPGNLSGIGSNSFQFAIWNSFPDGTPNFVSINPSVTVSTFPSGGAASSDRVKIVFADRVIENAWLQITVLADANTGLAANDVFYFGNARFDVTPTSPFPSQQVVINIFDVNGVRARQSQNSGVVSNTFDVDRSGVVNVFDTNAVRAGLGVTSLRFFTAPLPPSFSVADNELAIDSIMADSSWLDGLDPFSTKRRAERMLR